MCHALYSFTDLNRKRHDGNRVLFDFLGNTNHNRNIIFPAFFKAYMVGEVRMKVSSLVSK